MKAKPGAKISLPNSALFINEIESYEDHLLAKKAQKRLAENNDQDNIPFEEACRLAGWDDEEI